MNHTIVTEPVEPAAPVQRVQLDLSVEEFALLYALHYRHNGGHNRLRNAVEKGVTTALDNLHADWAAKVREAAPTTTKYVAEYASEDVLRVFGS